MSAYTKMMKAVRNGPERKRLKIRGHHWNFKKAKRSGFNKVKGTGSVEGQISHNVQNLPDDQVYYKITYQGLDATGKLKTPKIKIRIKVSPWKALVGKALGGLVAYFSGNPTAGATVDAIASKVLKGIHGKWETVSKGLVGLIAADLAKDLR